ncbi:MAG: hypothetical protein KJ041_03735, partial [Gammaproteobacteria bacterium]|nr:hypothetical protein [Gammaproteobacteria bacterium]
MSLCVTFTPDAWDEYKAAQVEACETDTQRCRPESVEIDWDEYEQAYIGSLAGHDLRYSFYRNEYDGKCYFYLESSSLGRHEWLVGSDCAEGDCVRCLDLSTALGVQGDPYDPCSAGVLTTECVQWIEPVTCNTCQCLCECVCVQLTMDAIEYSGKACWDDYGQAYVGEVYGYDEYGVCVSRTVRIPIDRWGDVCDREAYPGEPTACEPIHVIDNDDSPSDFYMVGSWTLDSTEGYRGSVRLVSAGEGEMTAEWRFRGLPAGRWRVAATWTPAADRAPQAVYRILAGETPLGAATVNQQAAPDDFTYDGAGWKRLGIVEISGGTLTVRLTDEANGTVSADAVHLEYIDDRCAIGLEISAEYGDSGAEDGWIRGPWQLMADCQLRNLEYSWTIERSPYTGDDDITASIRCAECGEECGPTDSECLCDDGQSQTKLPKSLTLTLTNNKFCSCLDGSYPMTYHTDPEPRTPGASFTEFWDSPVFQCNDGAAFYFRLHCSEAGVEGFYLQLRVAPGAWGHTMYWDETQCNGAFTQWEDRDS